MCVCFPATGVLNVGSVSLIQHMALSVDMGSFTSFLAFIFSYAICPHSPIFLITMQTPSSKNIVSMKQANISRFHLDAMLENQNAIN